jgi:hypothetical protein
MVVTGRPVSDTPHQRSARIAGYDTPVAAPSRRAHLHVLGGALIVLETSEQILAERLHRGPTTALRRTSHHPATPPRGTSGIDQNHSACLVELS